MFKIEDIESGAYRVAAEVLLIGLKHIQEHRMSYPPMLTAEQWFDEIVPELIWLCEVMMDDDFYPTTEDVDRFRSAERLLGEWFTHIWC